MLDQSAKTAAYAARGGLLEPVGQELECFYKEVYLKLGSAAIDWMENRAYGDINLNHIGARG